jgi:hypothetical protein
MPAINIEPSSDHPLPFSIDDEKPATFKDELVVTANTVDLLEGLGMQIEASNEDVEKTKKLVTAAIAGQKAAPLQQPTAAFAAREFLKAYGNQLALDVHEVRSAMTAKLMEIANCGDPKFELRALELLGKHSDIGLFTERSEITVNYKTSNDLENAIKDRVKRLLNSDVIDVTPIADDLDAELGVVNLGELRDSPDEIDGDKPE